MASQGSQFSRSREVLDTSVGCSKTTGHWTFLTSCMLSLCACVLYSISPVVMDVFCVTWHISLKPCCLQSQVCWCHMNVCDVCQMVFIFIVAYVRSEDLLFVVNRGGMYTFSDNTSSVSWQLWWHHHWAVQMGGYWMCECSIYILLQQLGSAGITGHLWGNMFWSSRQALCVCVCIFMWALCVDFKGVVVVDCCFLLDENSSVISSCKMWGIDMMVLGTSRYSVNVAKECFRHDLVWTAWLKLEADWISAPQRTSQSLDGCSSLT